jgi:hypothetical protein
VNGGQRVVLGAWLAMIVLATVRHVSDPSQGGLPPPSSFVASGVLYTMFFGAAGFAPGLFGTLAVGTIVAAVLKPYVDAKGAIPNSGPIFQLSNLLGQISGQVTPTSPSTQGASS